MNVCDVGRIENYSKTTFLQNFITLIFQKLLCVRMRCANSHSKILRFSGCARTIPTYSNHTPAIYGVPCIYDKFYLDKLQNND